MKTCPGSVVRDVGKSDDCGGCYPVCQFAHTCSRYIWVLNRRLYEVSRTYDDCHLSMYVTRFRDVVQVVFRVFEVQGCQGWLLTHDNNVRWLLAAGAARSQVFLAVFVKHSD